MDSIIIIGGGAAGLMTAYELSKHKHTVIILEAKNRLGGRIHTINDSSFSQPIEMGAEFIHGNLPLTLSLLNEAGIAYHTTAGNMFHLEKGKFKKQKEFNEGWGKLMKQMQELKQDIPLADFLNKYFGDDKYHELRESVKNFAGGFDLADISEASTKALYKEWNTEWEHQYRINGGYKLLIDYLEILCKENGCVIHTNCCVKKINWQKDEVNILTMCSRFFKSNKVVITVPVSVLKANAHSEDYIEFLPSIPQHIDAAKNIGYGDVIKILLEFNENFWNSAKKNVAFILTDEAVPTWWTQLPAESAILTGWIGGEKASSLKDNTDDEILKVALQSLANAFAMNIEDLKIKLKAFKIANWCKEADINGGYSFNTIKTVAARKTLQQPVNETIYFSGEALFEGTLMGTVEGALESGKKTALQVLKNL